MFFQNAGIEVALWIPPLVAFAISFFTSMGGVSGAFLLLPFQMSFLGYVTPSVSATNHLFNVVAIPSGVYRYHRDGRMVWPLTWIVVAGALPGVFIGAAVRVAWLPDPKNFRLFAAAVLLYVGGQMIRDLVGRRKSGSDRDVAEKRFRDRTRPHRPNAAGPPASGREPFPAVQVKRFSCRRLGYTFDGESFDVPLWGVLALGFAVGIAGGIYGIGGGAIIAPFLVTFFRLPVHTVAGAALMGTFLTSAAAVVFYQALARFYHGTPVAPDWLLGVLFGAGGMVGMYLGARCQKYVPAGAIRGMLAAIIVFTGLRYAAAFFGILV